MNTNIFDFQNSENSMQFNPLFLPTNTIGDNPVTAKSFKISNSSYLFSDIIKVFAGSADLAKNLDIKFNIPSEISSKPIPPENIFSFNITGNNSLQDLSKVLNDSKFSLSDLKEIFSLINQLYQSGQINLLQNGISISPDNPANDKVLTSDGLKAFLNELKNLFNNTDVQESSLKDKIKIDKNTKEIISKILNSLKNGGPVLINIIGKTETLKIELNKADDQVQNVAELSQGNKNYFNSDIQTASIKVQNNEENNLSDLEQSVKKIAAKEKTGNIPVEQTGKISKASSAEQTEQDVRINSKADTEQSSKINIKVSESDEIEKLFSKLEKNEAEILKDNKIPSAGFKNKAETTETINKTGSQKSSDPLKFIKIDDNSGKNDTYKLKFEILNNEKIKQEINHQTNAGNTKNLDHHAVDSIKNSTDSLTIEKLVASKSSLKNLNKLSNQQKNESIKITLKNTNNVKIEIENNTGEVQSAGKNKISAANQSYISSLPENNAKSLTGSNQAEKLSGEIKMNEIKPEKKINGIISERDDQKSDNVKQNNLNEDQKNEHFKALTSNSKVKISGLNIKPDSNPRKANDNSNLNTEASKEIKVAERDSQSINHKGTVSDSQSTENIKGDTSGKISLNNSSEDNSGDNLSNDKQDLLNASKEQDQIYKDSEDNTFSSYLNKTDINNVQNAKRPVYLSDISEQMKTIDSTEVVKEISKLASDKDQKNIVLKLVPETLGKVKISLDITNNIIHAHAEVENEAAKSLMQNNIENLKQALVQQGMQLNSLNISLANHQEQKSNRSYLSKRKFTYEEQQIGEIDEKEPTNISKHYGYNTYEFLA